MTSSTLPATGKTATWTASISPCNGKVTPVRGFGSSPGPGRDRPPGSGRRRRFARQLVLRFASSATGDGDARGPSNDGGEQGHARRWRSRLSLPSSPRSSPRRRSPATSTRSFGDRGKVIAFFCGHAVGFPVAIGLQGRIVAAGTNNHYDDFCLIRFRPNGGLDRSFGDADRGGELRDPRGGRPLGLLIDSSGADRGGGRVRGREFAGSLDSTPTAASIPRSAATAR